MSLPTSQSHLSGTDDHPHGFKLLFAILLCKRFCALPRCPAACCHLCDSDLERRVFHRSSIVRTDGGALRGYRSVYRERSRRRSDCAGPVEQQSCWNRWQSYRLVPVWAIRRWVAVLRPNEPRSPFPLPLRRSYCPRRSMLCPNLSRPRIRTEARHDVDYRQSTSTCRSPTLRPSCRAGKGIHRILDFQRCHDNSRVLYGICTCDVEAL